jgi:replicative DNA helicase
VTGWDAELALLAALLRCDARAATRVFDRVSPDDFADPSASQLARAIRRVALSGQAPTPMAVFAELRVMFGPAAAHPLVLRLSTLVGDAPTAAMAPRFADLVVEQAFRRAAVAAATKLTQAAEGSVEQLLDVWQELADEFTTQRRRLRQKVPA